MWGLPFYESFFYALFEHLHELFEHAMKLCQSSCHLKSKHHCKVIVLVIIANKNSFYLLILNIKLGELIYVSVLFVHLQHILTIPW